MSACPTRSVVSAGTSSTPVGTREGTHEPTEQEQADLIASIPARHLAQVAHRLSQPGVIEQAVEEARLAEERKDLLEKQRAECIQRQQKGPTLTHKERADQAFKAKGGRGAA